MAYGVATMMEGMHDGIAEALRVAALLGEHVPIPLLSEATGWDEAMVGEVTSAAERHGLARIEGDEFVFDHDLYRWALVEQLPTADRRHHHAELAHRLAAIGTGADLERTVLVARHAAAAGSAVATDLLARSALAAADGRFVAGLWAEAAAHNRVGLDASGEADAAVRRALKLRLGQAQQRNHDAPGTAATLRGLIQEARAEGDLGVWGSAALTLQRARFTLTTLRGDRSQEELDGFISATEGTSDGALQTIRAECFGILAEQTLVTGDVRVGMGLIGRAKRELVDPSDREAARLLAEACAHAIYEAAQALLFASALGKWSEVSVCEALLASALGAEGELKASVDHAHSALRL